MQVVFVAPCVAFESLCLVSLSILEPSSNISSTTLALWFWRTRNGSFDEWRV